MCATSVRKCGPQIKQKSSVCLIRIVSAGCLGVAVSRELLWGYFRGNTAVTGTLRAGSRGDSTQSQNERNYLPRVNCLLARRTE